ncbi:exopolysaccharide biosynthesis polyprenyl glycosylphosphotransferase [Dictyobacter aurantiacus]|uniref:Bacterial sugar transferase domain-containing protein n=1 Tax=Dictyobacter aurantiacus TaxID=1936993 RepID=A0A401ZJ28_9CHLR|nr:exopolysaccharide biosynthesis polyprenyl glycosylphosphotransferase [Dictyobacter aurantiacus]GCE06857.1 hypothetical protein KDAU_41860 [Dictyobacter aurantiacus]
MAGSLLMPLSDLLLPRKRRWTARRWRWLLIGGDTLIFLFVLSYALFLVSMNRAAFPIVIDTSSYLWNPFYWEVQGGLAWLIALYRVRPYDQLYTCSDCRGILSMACALGLMLACWLLFLVLSCQDDVFIGLAMLLPFACMLVPIFGLWRACYASLRKFVLFETLTVIVGASTISDAALNELCHSEQCAMTILGYVDESLCVDDSRLAWPLLGGRMALHDLLASDLVDILVVSPDCYVDLVFYPILAEAQARGVQILSLADFYEGMAGKCFLLQDPDLWKLVTRVYHYRGSLLYRCWRRLLDLGAGVLGLMLLFCMLPLLALLIRLDSPGPVFYRQERMGYRGRSFRIWKFRSMCVNAEAHGAFWAGANDMRVTRVGRFLRATHLDELPQVINILRGEMSLIGPRPERPMFVSQLEQVLPVFHCRLEVKPGLTGWAQVKMPYARSYGEAAVKLQYDLYYIQHQSFVLDVSILLQTVLDVLWCSGRRAAPEM